MARDGWGRMLTEGPKASPLPIVSREAPEELALKGQEVISS